MRRVEGRGAYVPSSLLEGAAKKAIADVADHFRLPAETRLSRRVPLDRAVLYSVDVSRALADLFKQKCAYCESRLDGTTGAIDHFRPVQNAIGIGRRAANDSADHYGWFAYEWRNFFLTCSTCNRAKANIFPVDGRRAPLLCSWVEANDSEVGTLINPCEDDPERHFLFTADGLVSELTARGSTTIQVLGLNRQPLVSDRMAKLSRCIELLDGLRSQGVIARPSLDREISDDAPYAGVARNFLKQLLAHIARYLSVPAPRGRDLVKGLTGLIPLLPQGTSLPDFFPNTSAPELVLYEDSAILTRARGAFASLSRETTRSVISEVEISNFRGIKHLRVDFRPNLEGNARVPSMMLLGENATGKSSVLQAIALCLMGKRLRESAGLAAEDFLSREPQSWRLAGDLDCSVRVKFVGGASTELVIDAARRQFQGTDEPATVLLAYGARRFFEHNRKRGGAADAVQTLFNPLKTLADPALWLGTLDQSKFFAVARAMREIFVLHDDDNLVRSDAGEIYVRAHSRDTPIHQMSEGYRSLFAMAVSAMRYLLDVWGNLEDARGVVLIDEVETHLHPRWKVRVMSALRNAFPRVQFISTTHDPLCLRGLDDGEVHVLYRDENRNISQLIDLPNVKGLRTDQLLTSDYFGLSSTADPEFERKLDEYADSLSHSESLDSGLSRRGALASEIESTMLIGDTPLQQVVQQATKQFVERYSVAPIANRANLRQSGVKAVLDALIKARGNP